jgi:modulator of FtsH protease
MDQTFLGSWREFFLGVSGGAVALMGLGFVAMSIHLKAILSRPALVNRAKGVLTNLTAVFVRCSLALMGSQGHQAVALELFGICAIAVFIGAVNFREVLRAPGPVPRPALYRYLGGLLCFLIEMTGAVVLFLGSDWGLYMVACAMMAGFYFVISGAWLLMIGVTHDEETHRQRRRR